LEWGSAGRWFESSRPDCFKSRRWLQKRLATGFELFVCPAIPNNAPVPAQERSACKLFARGTVRRDPVIAPVLLNDADAIKAAVMATPSLLQHRTRTVSVFTSLEGVSLLHVAAEYGNFNAARALVEAGANTAFGVQEVAGSNPVTPITS
jgi:hypothetical protein